MNFNARVSSFQTHGNKVFLFHSSEPNTTAINSFSLNDLQMENTDAFRFSLNLLGVFFSLLFFGISTHNFFFKS